MFLLIGVIILIISFVIALISLLKDQKKQEKIDAGTVDMVPKVDAATKRREEELKIPNKTHKPKENIGTIKPKGGEQPGEAGAPRVDEESVPFPWEQGEDSKKDLSALEELIRKEAAKEDKAQATQKSIPSASPDLSGDTAFKRDVEPAPQPYVLHPKQFERMIPRENTPGTSVEPSEEETIPDFSVGNSTPQAKPLSGTVSLKDLSNKGD